MRALTLVSAGMLGVASAGCLFAQDSIQAERVQVPQLSIHLLSSDGSYLQYQLSDPAYIAAFEVYSGGAAELLYPYASDDYPEAVGMHVHALSYLTDEGAERQSLLASYPLQSAWACLFVVASRQPLKLDGYATHPLALAKALGYRSTSMTRPEAALAPVLDPSRPANPNDWATDELCGPIHQSFAVAGPTLGEFAEEPYIPAEDLAAAGVGMVVGYGSAVAPAGVSAPPVCVRASTACTPKQLPFKPVLDAPTKDRPVVMKPDGVDKAGVPALRIGTREDRPPTAYADPKIQARTAGAGVASGGGFDRGSATTYSTNGSGSSAPSTSSSGSSGASSNNASSGGNRSGGSSGSPSRSGGSYGGNSGGSSSGGSSGGSAGHSGGGYSGGGYSGGGVSSGGGSFGGGGGASSGGSSAGGRH